MGWNAIIITGASKGFGRAVAMVIAKQIQTPLFFVLHGRNEQDLLDTKLLIESAREEASLTQFKIVVNDLADISSLDSISAQLFDHLSISSFPAHNSNETEFEDIYFFNNAGSLGTLASIGSDAHNIVDFSTAINLNVTASCYLTQEFMKRIRRDNYLAKARTFYIVNISSLAAVKAFETWGIYCAGKAARDMFHKTLAEELKTSNSSRDIKILSYAPGPLDTNMQKEIREGKLVDKNTQEFFQNMQKQNQLIDPLASAAKLFESLTSRPFENGNHLDYFDL